jgi:Zn-finger protein
MPSSCNYPPQDSLVQHFPVAHVDDLEERVNQLMAARRAHTQPPHTHATHKSCSYCYHPFDRIDDCPFINHYMNDEDDASKSSYKHVQTTTILGSEEKVVNKVEEQIEHIEPPSTLSLSNNKEVSTEAHSFIIFPLEMQ